MTQVLSTSDEEQAVSVQVIRLDDALSALREKLRHGICDSDAVGELQEVA